MASSADWKFYEQQPTDLINNPISAEFFSTEAVGDVTEALIREGVQNTLDARLKTPNGSRQTARARVFLSEQQAALPPAKAKWWFSSLWPHVTTQGNGLRNQPAIDEPCQFLVFEDFGTMGLTGDPAEHRVVADVTNHFLNFFRAEGHSDKSGQDRGSWGVGKTVFPRASRIGSFFGLTVRSDDARQLLLGRSVLKYHQVNDRSYKSDGYFGVGREDGFMLPADDPAILARFRDDFRISRRAESGLSVVVPWYEDGGSDGVTRDKVVAAVLRGFFYPVLMGHLSVTIATPADDITLESGSILQTIQTMEPALARDLLPLAELAEWAQTRMLGEFLSLDPPSADQSQKWSSPLVPPAVIANIRQSLAQRNRLAVRVPMHVQSRTSDPQPTFFNIFLEHSERDSERPVFIRDELIILDVKSPRIPQVRALVIVEDDPLATLLRDAETPAHTQWNQDTSHFKNKYKFGPGVIQFVRLSVLELLRIVNEAEQQPDPTITIDFFSVPSPPDKDESVPGRRRRARPEPGGGPTPPLPPLPPVPPRRFRIEKLLGGFGIRPGQPGASLPAFIDVQVAYDIRRGNPLKKYHPADFDLNRAPIRHDTNANNISVKQADANRMLVAVDGPDFNLDVTGFDPDRDLYVKAEAKEAADVD